MQSIFKTFSALVLLASMGLPARAQLGMFSKDQLMAVTRGWTGERFADGRPKVSDAMLERLKTVDAEEAWGELRQSGYFNQFEGGWKVINPGARVAGRVVTAVFMPSRPDLEAYIREQGKVIWNEDECGENNNHVVIGKENYFLSADGLLMPTKKDQQPPDLRYFNRTGN